ncbi:DUF3304 domain-containing protein [Burkholderia multivorans]|uniref:DUF3304 domain-containing protein n=1 Tax=Burkholderia multivorans TaxID=87883 RepID=UPI000D011A6D|nr:DUF3304 domain-containing protein [Burkholderia multivorans]MBN6731750.1 DUF3304 domain-containing protein [Burkholderia multivorans]MBN6735008.1 DUF3304 domain-containing protein [Burkholderia multivorans]MBN8165564.1 DUF3304 domain-containing protein [Burkholderia multivorans]MBN8171354.1 DUF3304 domain-containing protein [Burkholderia multivorans]MBN8177139.1 DUF3304 domain-containing protein [Burkholderia multivorans]
MKANRLSGLVVVLLALLTGCTNLPAHESSEIQTPKRVELSSGGTKTLNYTPWYIHTFSISGPKGSGIGGGGPNVMPMRDGGPPSGGGAETCCTSYPREWQPDLRLTVRWKADKKMDGKTLGYWYKAENVRIEPYITGRTSGVWAIFLPGDRVKLVVGNPNARDLAPNAGPPAASDPYVVQGTLDEEWNRLYR